MRQFGSFFEGALTRQERACLGSFVRHGHRVTLFSYAALDLPPGVERGDAAAILPRDCLYSAESGGHAGSFAQFTDHFRYAMIRQTGLVWIDTDVVCLRRDWPAGEWLIARQDAFLVNGAVLGMPRDHPALTQAIAVAERLAGIAVWGLLGPHLLTALSWDYDFNREVLPADSFYPLHYGRARELLRPLAPGERLNIPADAYCLHLWNEVLRVAGHDRAAGPPPGSALAALLDRAETA